MALIIAGRTYKDRDTVEPSPLIDPSTPSGIQPVGQSGYTLQLSEEFNGSVSVVDSGAGLVTFRSGGPQWATWYPDWGRFNEQTPGGNHTNTNEACYYSTDKVSVSGGNLVLANDQETTVSGLPYTAGMIQSLGFYTPLYGYFEASIKLDSDDNGAWPAFWASASAANTWPPEIDFWEYFAPSGTYGANVYLPSDQYLGTVSAPTEGFTSFHTYGCKWAPTGVTWYLDGVQVATTTKTPAGSLYVVLKNGCYADHNPVFASDPLIVDYIRCWS